MKITMNDWCDKFIDACNDVILNKAPESEYPSYITANSTIHHAIYAMRSQKNPDICRIGGVGVNSNSTAIVNTPLERLRQNNRTAKSTDFHNLCKPWEFAWGTTIDIVGEIEPRFLVAIAEVLLQREFAQNSSVKYIGTSAFDCKNINVKNFCHDFSTKDTY